MRGEGGSNVDREGGEERDKPLGLRIPVERGGTFKCWVRETKLQVCAPSNGHSEEQLKRWTDGTRRNTRPGLTQTNMTSPSGYLT